jgi:hypothetical protein
MAIELVTSLLEESKNKLCVVVNTQIVSVVQNKLWGNCGGNLQKYTESGVYWRTP